MIMTKAFLNVLLLISYSGYHILSPLPCNQLYTIFAFSTLVNESA